MLQCAVDGAEADRRRSLRGREPVRPRRSRGRQSRTRSRRSTRSSNCASSSNGAAWARSIIPACGCASAYAAFDAERKFAVPNIRIADPKACQCGEVLKGVIKPHQCKVFGTACTPETPLGSLMVSTEGACAAYYKYGRTDMSLVADAAGMNVPARTGARRGGTVRDARINMSHGGGGKAMRALIEDVFVAAFDNPMLGALEDQARIPTGGPRRVTATDSRSPPTPTWSIRYSFPAATSARSRWRHRQRSGDVRRAAAVPVVRHGARGRTGRRHAAPRGRQHEARRRCRPASRS